MYADKVTEAMQGAIDETNRRRAIQMDYNQEHGIEPASIVKEVRDLTQRVQQAAAPEAKPEVAGEISPVALPKSELKKLIDSLETEMKAAAKALEFEKAAVLRDQLIELRQVMALKEPGQRDLSLELVEQSVQRPKRRS
jgi:excinuclease ABC subunit B